jgi:hypothetical protein
MAGRFSARAEAALRDAGWEPGRSVPGPTETAIAQVCQVTGDGGGRHRPFPAAVAALTEFGGLTVDPEGADAGSPGGPVARRPFALDPTLAASTADTLADVGRLLDVRLFPLGVEGDLETVLAIDEAGRVFAIDHAGEWFLGGSLDEAIETLVHGREPSRVYDDGGWDPLPA